MFTVKQFVRPMSNYIWYLQEKNMLPQLKDNFQSHNRYPPFVYKLKTKYNWAFAHFEFFVKSVFRKMLIGCIRRDSLYHEYITTSFSFNGKNIDKIISYNDFYKTTKWFSNLTEFIENNFRNTGFQLEYDFNLQYGLLSGTPDIVIKNSEKNISVYDIKVISEFNSQKHKEIMFQLFMYVILATKLGFTIEKIGIILPMQNKVLEYNVSDYNCDDLLQFLTKNMKYITRVGK